MISNASGVTVAQKSHEESTVADIIICDYYAPRLLHPATKCAVFLVYVAYISVAVMGMTSVR